MQTTRWVAAMAALCLVGAAGCGDDDNGGNGGTPRPTATTRPTNTPGGATPTQAAGATPTRTFTPVPGATNTPGGSSGAVTVQRFVSGVLGSIASLSDFAGGGTGAALRRGAAIQIPLPPIAVPCTNGGTLTTGCTPAGGGSDLTFTFDACRNRGGGAESFLDGTIAIDSPAGCPGIPLPVGQPFGVTVDARIEASGGGNDVAGDFDVVETVTLGNDGSATVEAAGSVDTSCTGAVSFETLQPLFYPAGAECGTAGVMRVQAGGESHRITLTAGGGVELDYGDDGSVDESFARCTDAGLAQCD